MASNLPRSLPTDGDAKMRASKLITISTAAVLMGGTSLAVGHSWQSGQSQNNASTQAPAAMSQGNAQAAEQGSKLKGSRQFQGSQTMTQHGQALSTQRGRAISGARGQAMIERGEGITGARGQVGPERTRAAAPHEPQLALHARQSLRQTGGPTYAHATATSEVRGSLTPEQRAHLREMARRELPRVSNIPEVRVNAIVPRDVQLAPVPGEIARYYPRFRHNQAFLYHNRIVLVDPATSRIVAVIAA
jgi:Protein of unknown function (DUF1236)